MARIISQSSAHEGIIAQVLLSKEETKELGGEMDDVTLFTATRKSVPTRISLRGKNEATKYFLIPKQLRKSLNTLGSVTCQRIKHNGKDIFVYIVDADTNRDSYVTV